MVILLTSTQPPWAGAVAQVIGNAFIAIVLLGLVLIWLPIWKRPWTLELAIWLIVAGVVALILLLIGLVIQTNVVAGTLVLVAFLSYLGYWLPRSNRRIEAETDAVIAATPAALFALATDPSAAQRLYSSDLSMTIEDGRPLGVGSRIKARAARSRVEAVDVVVEYEPPHRFAGKTTSGAPPNLLTLTFEPTAEGTLVHYRYTGLLSFPRAVMSGYRRGQIREQLIKMRQEWFQRLRRELERSAV